MTKKKTRLGNQKPTQSLFLPFKRSKYKKAVEIYNKTNRTCQKWQEYLLKNLLSINSDGLWTHTKFGYSLPRRNGKNEVVAMRELYGLVEGEKILHTAHRTTTSHSAWERLCSLLDSAGYIVDQDYKAIKQFGLERIVMAEGGEVSFRTRTSKGGLGEGFDLLIIDEAQEYTDDQESSLKYVVTDSKNPQTLFCGTPPTPISSGTVFTNLRNKALQGETENTGWAEWSVEDETDPYDVEAWYKTNPSLGTVFTERSVKDEIGSDVVDFNIQRLGLWLRYNQKSAISENDWNVLAVPRKPKLVGPLFVGIKYGNDGANVALSVAVKTNDEKIFVESVDCQSIRNGNRWIIEFIKSAKPQSVVVDGANGISLLTQEFKENKLKSPIYPTVKEIISANSIFENAIYQESLAHSNQPSLTQVVTNCEKRNIGSNGGFGYRAQFEDNEIALLDSILLAHWACFNAKPVKKQKIRY